jgi:hypothetical protein
MIFPPQQILWGRLIKEDAMSGERRSCCEDMRAGFWLGNLNEQTTWKT